MAEKPKDLEERTAVFVEDVRAFVRGLPRRIANIEDVKQLVRASGSVAANCIEANEALGEKDRVMTFRTCRKRSQGKPALVTAASRGRCRANAEFAGSATTGGARAEAHFFSDRQEARMKFDDWGFIWRLAAWRLRFHS